MTADRLPTFTPPEDYRAWVVKVAANIHDKDEGRFPVHVHAIGPLNAKALAVESVREQYPSAFALSAQPECVCGHEIHTMPCISWQCGCRVSV